MRSPEIGDPMEVKFMTPEGEVWKPATIAFVDGAQIVAAFSDGQRLALQRGSGRGLYRLLRVPADVPDSVIEEVLK